MGDRIETGRGAPPPDFRPPVSGTPGAAEVSTTTAPALARILDSLTQFSVLTRILRGSLPPGIAPHVTVSGWKGGILRVTLDRPAMAMHWRFEAPALKARLAKVPELAGLQDIRLVLMTGTAPVRPPRPGRPSRPPALETAPPDALALLANGESHPLLKEALRRLAEAAARARARSP